MSQATVGRPGAKAPTAAPLPSDVLARLTAVATTSPNARTRQTYAPFTGASLAEVPVSTAADVAQAAARARAAQVGWASAGFKARAAVLLRFHDLLLDRQDEVLDVMQLETGKARKHAFEEVLDAAVVARYYARTAARHLAPTRRHGALPMLTRTVEHHHPKGLVGVISPWNYPLSMSITDALPALMAGNAVLLRPDEQTPLTALWAVALLREAGLPADVLPVVLGPGPELGPPLIAEVDFVMFTGSTATGRIVAQQCAERLIGCSLELGGKNPMIVLSDADVQDAVDGAIRGCFANSGQLCISFERIYVERPIAKEFTSRLAERAAAMQVTSAMDFSADMGSLISERQLSTVTEQVRDAVDKGVTVRAGGHALPDVGPFFYAPTVLTGVTEDMVLSRAETFGPVVSVYEVADADEAVARANDSDYGLNSSVWTKDLARGRAVAARLKTGTANVNDAYAAAWASVDSPMGGMKQSGLGRRHGRDGILKYTEPQTVAVQRLVPVGTPRGMAEQTYAKVMTRALRLIKATRMVP